MTDQAVSPLRWRMIEDMSIRKFAPRTQRDYVQRDKEFAAFLGRSPDAAKAEDVRGFQLHLASWGAGTPKINATVSALRFLFNVTLDRPDLAKQLAFMHEPRKVSRGSKQPAAGLAVSGPEPDQPDDDAPTHARLPCRGRDRGDYEAGDAAHLAPQLCHASAGAGHRHSRHPGSARPCQARDHRALCPRRHQHNPHCHESARPDLAYDAGRGAAGRMIERR
jgi:hypothetical protein